MVRKEQHVPFIVKILANPTFRIATVAVAAAVVVLIVLALAGVFKKPRSYSGPERAIADGNGQGIDLVETASEDAAVIEHLKTGTVVLIGEDKGDWLYVTVRRTGKTGWCKDAEVKRENR